MSTLCRNGHPMTVENSYIYKPKNRPRAYAYCRACRDTERERRRSTGWMKEYLLDRRYGLTRTERSELLESQDGLCAICYERPAVTIDHDHDTGRVRGMLCKACNVALGVLGDDEESMRRVLEYLTVPRLEEAV